MWGYPNQFQVPVILDYEPLVSLDLTQVRCIQVGFHSN